MANTVAIVSPCGADSFFEIERNLAYARECLHDSLMRGEAPFASHLLYTQVLDDRVAAQREQGMLAGALWEIEAQLLAVYTDRGVSAGMRCSIARAQQLGIPVEERTLQ
ncbi:MAG: hypothetical protein WC683_06190 [bacterium]